MKKIIITAFIAGLSFLALESNAQTGTYTDAQGTYRYETREERVWIPEHRTGGIFGVGGRTVPGHYENRSTQVKVYRDQNGQYNTNTGKGWEGKHPHGMPPGQRKKAQGANNRSDRNNDGVIDERDRRYDRNNDGVIDNRDRDNDHDSDDKKNKKSKSGKKGKSKG
ncbi:MAG: hypothetical protein H7Y07_10015 [Pyrinomonadaceae bacterium]|nr:hypothetical protein [Sphingobacteriaceae bacterium]